ncbi:MAG: hypothetical protein IPJ88_03455 [Myxococcales bacterium]|nr:MAG: hypothetical protein IPJ88_03455 [Myxococcales bacterium]
MKLLRILFICTFLLSVNACDDEAKSGSDANVDDDSAVLSDAASDGDSADAASDVNLAPGDADMQSGPPCGTVTCSADQYCVHPVDLCPTPALRPEAPQAPVPGGTPYCASLENCSTCGCFTTDPCAPNGNCSSVSDKIVTCSCPGGNPI